LPRFVKVETHPHHYGGRHSNRGAERERKKERERDTKRERKSQSISKLAQKNLAI